MYTISSSCIYVVLLTVLIVISLTGLLLLVRWHEGILIGAMFLQKLFSGARKLTKVCPEKAVKMDVLMAACYCVTSILLHVSVRSRICTVLFQVSLVYASYSVCFMWMVDACRQSASLCWSSSVHLHWIIASTCWRRRRTCGMNAVTSHRQTVLKVWVFHLTARCENVVQIILWKLVKRCGRSYYVFRFRWHLPCSWCDCPLGTLCTCFGIVAALHSYVGILSSMCKLVAVRILTPSCHFATEF